MGQLHEDQIFEPRHTEARLDIPERYRPEYHSCTTEKMQHRRVATCLGAGQLGVMNFGGKSLQTSE